MTYEDWRRAKLQNFEQSFKTACKLVIDIQSELQTTLDNIEMYPDVMENYQALVRCCGQLNSAKFNKARLLYYFKTEYNKLTLEKYNEENKNENQL